MYWKGELNKQEFNQYLNSFDVLPFEINTNNKVTIEDLKILISCYVNEDYTLAHTTKLYNLYKNLYWYFLELLDELNINLNESDIMA